MIEVFRPGWRQPVMKVPVSGPFEPAVLETDGIKYARVELRDMQLSHAAAIYLLQGINLRDLLSDVMLPETNALNMQFYSVIFAEPPCLWRPPPTITRAVFARLLERPVGLSPEEVLHKLFLAEVSRPAPLLLAPPLGVQQGVHRRTREAP